MKRARSYEVNIEVGGKPEIDGIFEDEKIALERAEYLLKQAKYTAVRVYQVNARDDHKVIFEKFYTGTGAGSTISAVEEAFLCLSLSDVYSFDSRQTLLRLMRSYFDQQVILPLELLHSYMGLRYLERDQLLFNQAIHRLAALQARRARVSANERYDEIMKLVRQVVDYAKTNEASFAPYAAALSDGGLPKLLEQIDDSQPVTERDRVFTYAVASLLKEARDWNLKLTLACHLFEPDLRDEALGWLDEILAEIIDGNEPVRAAIGYAPDLASALGALLATSEGTWDDRLPGTEALQKLSDIMAHSHLPRVRAALLTRVANALDGKGPLTKLGRTGDSDALKRLIGKLQEFGGFMGGPAMTAALTRRAKSVFGSGDDDLSFENTVSVLSAFLPNPAGKIGYLLDLLASDLGRKKAALLTQEIAGLFGSLRSINDFAPGGDVSWSQDEAREDFRRRLQAAGIPRRLADGLLTKLTGIATDSPSPPPVPPPGAAVPPSPPARPPVQSITEASGAAARSPGPGKLVLSYRGARHVLGPEQTPFVIGRGSTCNLTVDWGTASRSHALIEVVGPHFMLVDQSKNGTFVRVGSQPVIVLAKASLALTGHGVIVIGDHPDTNIDAAERAAIQFQRLPG
jgi:hypothetical protein